MKKIISQETINSFPKRSIVQLQKDFLHDKHDLGRTMAIICIGSELANNYFEISKLLLNEMQNKIHFGNVRLGIKSAWTLAIVLIENLKDVEHIKLKQEFDKWDIEERDALLEWLKDFPEHLKILKQGNL